MANDVAQRWREGLAIAVRRAGGPASFDGPPGIDVQLRRWMRPHGPIPEMKTLISLAEILGEAFPLSEQIRLLSPSEDGSARAQPPEPLRSRQLLLTKLWYAVSEATQGRPLTADLVRAVLSPADGEDASVAGRWRARQFDVPTGVIYKHVAFRAVEFQRGPAPRSGSVVTERTRSPLFPPWSPTDFERMGADLDELKLSAAWIRRVLSNEVVVDTWDHRGKPDFRLWKENAYDRLELLWRLRSLTPLIPHVWYGEIGGLHRGLLYNAHSDRVRHMVLVRAYAEQSPDPAAIIHPEWLTGKGFNRLALVGPASALSEHVGAILAEAWSWQFINTRDHVGELTGTRPAYDAPDRTRRFEHTYRELTSSRYADAMNITVLRDIDTLLTDGTLSQQATDLLTAPGTYTLVLRPTPDSDALWRERQASLLPPGTPISPANEPTTVTAALATISRTLHRSEPDQRNWTAISWTTTIPWWPDPARPGEVPPFWDPRIGDLLLRASYALGTRLAKGKLPGARIKRPSFAHGTLLGNFARQLHRDPQAANILAEHARRPSRP